MNWKRLLLIALVAGGFAFISTPRSDAQVSVGIGFPGGYGYGYPGYGYPGYGYGGYGGYGYGGHRYYGGNRYYGGHRRHHYYHRY